MTVVVGISGPARSGKDTFASMLADELHKIDDKAAVATVASFAGPLKAMLAQILLPLAGNDLSLVQMLLYGDLKDEVFPPLGTTPRRALQTLGTEWGRETIKPTLWIDVMKANIEIISNQQHFNKAATSVILIADARFDNEAELCDYVFRIDRHAARQVGAHVSERGIGEKYIHSNIDNNSGYSELREMAQGVARMIIEGQEDERESA